MILAARFLELTFGPTWVTLELPEMRYKKINAKAGLSLGVLAVVMGLLLFVPAWAIYYWEPWIYLSFS